MQRIASIESLEDRQLFAVTSGLTSPTSTSLLTVTTTISATSTTGTVRPGDKVAFNPQPDPPGLPFFSAVAASR
jgi:hypothetical protein